MDAEESPIPEICARLSENQTLRQPTLSRLLELQRVLYATAMDPEVEPKDKANCAKAWRDLEILRYAKQGKPLAMNATVRLETRNPAPQLTLAPFGKAA